MRFKSIIIASTVGTVLFSSVGFASVGSAASSYETEVIYGVNFRTQPSTSSKVIRMLKRGEDIHVISKNGNWLKIETKDGKTGYISASSKYTDYNNSGTETKILYGVNLRSGPGTSYKVIRMLKKGESVSVIEKKNSYWLKVKTKDGKTGYISADSKYTNYSSSGSKSGSGTVSKSRSAVVSTAKSYKGDFKYKWGAEPWTTKNKYTDCSAFMQLVFRKHGVELPRTSRQQAKAGKSVKKSDLKPGDLVFFDTTGNGTINHVGMYIGNNEFIHASPIFNGIGVSKLTSSYWSKHYKTARSVL